MPESSKLRSLAPAFTLIVLSPVIAEVLYGSTHLTTLFLLIPQMAVYGGAALIIRTLVRRSGRSWLAILLLGLAYAVLEECVILQTSLAPLLFAADLNHVYGRTFGVNWPYLLWALGYEAVWSIVIPIQVTELIFPARRSDPWLGSAGLIVAAVVFIAGSRFVWFIWTQVAMKKFYHGPAFEIPIATIAVAVAVAAALAVAAFLPWTRVRQQTPVANRHPRSRLLMVSSLVWGLAWFVLVILATGYVPSVPPWIQMTLAALLSVFALLAIPRLLTRFVWVDRHRLALISGALLASMAAGVVASGITLPIDMAAKLTFDAAALLFLARLSRRLRASRIENATLPA